MSGAPAGASGGARVARVAEGVTIRPARPGDARSFLRAFRSVAAERRFIHTEVVPEERRGYRRRFRRSFDEEGAELVAVDGDEVVGALSIRRGRRPHERHVATLAMFVVASHRRRGLGTALMEEALRWARALSIERVELSVYPGNEAARALYRRFGFVEEGRLVRRAKKSYGYEDEVLMARWFGPAGTGDAGAGRRAAGGWT